jgi:hypothetical protein
MYIRFVRTSPPPWGLLLSRTRALLLVAAVMVVAAWISGGGWCAIGGGGLGAGVRGWWLRVSREPHVKEGLLWEGKLLPISGGESQSRSTSFSFTLDRGENWRGLGVPRS